MKENKIKRNNCVRMALNDEQLSSVTGASGIRYGTYLTSEDIARGYFITSDGITHRVDGKRIISGPGMRTVEYTNTERMVNPMTLPGMQPKPLSEYSESEYALYLMNHSF